MTTTSNKFSKTIIATLTILLFTGLSAAATGSISLDSNYYADGDSMTITLSDGTDLNTDSTTAETYKVGVTSATEPVQSVTGENVDSSSYTLANNGLTDSNNDGQYTCADITFNSGSDDTCSSVTRKDDGSVTLSVADGGSIDAGTTVDYNYYPELVTLSETDKNTGSFTGSITVSSNGANIGDGTLQENSDGATLTAFYSDSSTTTERTATGTTDYTPPKSISIDSPSSLTYKQSTQSLSVDVSYTETNPDQLDIVFKDGGGNTATYSFSGEASTDVSKSLDLSSPDSQSGGFVDGNTYKIEAQVTDDAGNSGSETSSSDLLQIDDTDPTGTSVDNTPINTQSGQSADVEVSFAEANPDKVDVKVGSQTTQTFNSVSGGTNTLSVDAANLPDSKGDYEISVTVTDLATNSDSVTNSQGLTVDDTSPTVDNFNPSELKSSDSLTFDVSDTETSVDTSTLSVTVTDSNTGDNEELLNTGTGSDAVSVTGGTVTVDLSATDVGDVAEGSLSVSASIDDQASNTGSGSATLTVDDTAPTVSDYAVSNPSSQDVKVVFNSSEQLSTVSASVSGAESSTLSGVSSDFTETSIDSNYQYEATYSGSTDGDYTVTLDTAEDAAGNDGSSSESGTVTVDNVQPSASKDSPPSNARGTVDVTTWFTSSQDVDTKAYKYNEGSGYTTISSPTSFDTTTLGDGDVDFKLVAGDNEGNTDESSVATVTIDNTDLSFDSAITGHDTDGDSIATSKVTLTFSDSTSGVNTNTLEESDFSIVENDYEVTGSSGMDTVNPTLTLNDSLGTGETVDVELTGTVEDAAGNSITGVTRETDDGLSPDVSSVETVDSDANGKIEDIKVTFTETVENVDAGDVSIDDAGISVASARSSSGSSINFVVDSDSQTGGAQEIEDTSSTPKMEFNKGDVQDTSGNVLINQPATTASDGASPVLMYAEIDHTDSDSSATHVTLEFSEDVKDSSTSNSNGVTISETTKEFTSTPGSLGKTRSVNYGSLLQSGDSPVVSLGSDVVDGNGNQAVNKSGSSVEVDSFRKDLGSGWNFVSFPIAGTSSPDVSSVLGDTSNVNAVWKYTSDGWESWTPSSSNQDDFSTVSGGEGYLVDVDSGYTISPNVNNVQTTKAAAKVQLSEGYNLIGQFEEFHQDADASDDTGAFGSLGGNFWKVSEQTSGLQTQETTAADGIKTGSAYWVQTQGDLSDGSTAYTAN